MSESKSFQILKNMALVVTQRTNLNKLKIVCILWFLDNVTFFKHKFHFVLDLNMFMLLNFVSKI